MNWVAAMTATAATAVVGLMIVYPLVTAVVAVALLFSVCWLGFYAVASLMMEK